MSQLNNYTLAPVEPERVSEAAGVNSAAGSFGLSFGLAMAGGIMLAALPVSFTQMTESSEVMPAGQQELTPVGLRADAPGPGEVVAQGGGVAEAHLAGDPVDRGVGALEQLLGRPAAVRR